MNERVFAHLGAWLQREPVVLASVLDTRGATPRKRGARMLIGAADTEFSIGGGMAEARVIAAARGLLDQAQAQAIVHIDLSGKAGAAGVCGGSMRLGLRRWQGADDLAQVQQIARQLQAGQQVPLTAADLGSESGDEILDPDPRLLIVGGGHCALALYQLALYLDFDIWVFDPRAECFSQGQFASATCLWGGYGELARALQTSRQIHAILLNRDFPSDVAALEVLCQSPPQFLSMMGSAKRIAQVRAALPEHKQALQILHAPVGLEIGAQTPHEIAVSILAQVIRQRNPE